ncbi:MAG TPA: AI-2E family transporter, partial [Gemmataceae bacterium]|nr:AI-2E family transporter [Gemmataceae bacterium]
AGLPRIPACIVTLVLAGTIIVIIVNGFVQQMGSLAEDIPTYKTEISGKLHDLQKASAHSWIGSLINTEKEAGKSEPDASGVNSSDNTIHAKMEIPVLAIVQSAAGIAADILVTAVIVFVLAFLLLIRREDLRNRLIHVLGSDNRINATRALDDASKRVSRYLFFQLAINLGFGAVVAVGLALIGIPHALVWGALAAMLRYVPFVGGWIAAAFPLIASLVMPTWTPFVLTGVFFIVLELVQSYLVEPLVFGHSVGVSSPGQILAMLFWGTLWGPVGLILATPLTACLCVLGHHFPGFRFLATLMGDGEIVDKRDALYQRLLAGDTAEACTLAEAYLKENSLLALVDHMLIPALLSAQYDRRRGDLSSDDAATIAENVREIFVDVRSDVEAPPADTAAPQEDHEKTHVLVVEFPFNDDIDKLVMSMVKSATDPTRVSWSTIVIGDTTLDEADRTEQMHPALIIISTTGDQNLGRIRGACRTMHKMFPESRTVACCWGLESEREAEVARLRSAGAAAICTSIEHATQQIAAEPAGASLVTS